MAKRIINKATVNYALQGLALVIVAMITLEGTSLVQYFFSRGMMEEEATARAKGRIQMTNSQITKVMDQVETALDNNIWSVQTLLSNSDSLWSLTQRIVQTNDFIYGSAIAFVENYFPERGYWFSPYSYKKDSLIVSVQLGNENYNYLQKEWFTVPLETEKTYWSEPYYDTGGGEELMTTFSAPVRDVNGEIFAVLTADISLEWLTNLVGKVEEYPGAFSMLISPSGKLMVSPSKAFVMKKTAQEVTAMLEDTTAVTVSKAMLRGETGSATVLYKGEKEMVCYAPIERAGWSMAVIIPYNEIFSEIEHVNKLVRFLQIIGVMLLGFILYLAFRNQVKLRDVSEKKNLIENELHIAREIQMSMLPKTFPPYPDRQDLEMSGTIIPAKEVSGDLYDFHIYDDLLYFCIGDVSGKGIPASLVMATTRSLFRTTSAHENSPHRIVASMNESMADVNESNMFVTFFVGILDLNTGHLRYCNAGHNAPVLIHSDGNVGLLEVEPNLPLGVLPGYHYLEQCTDLSCGESLFLYTDGLTEAADSMNRLFGEERMLRTAAHVAAGSAKEMLKGMEQAVVTHVGEAQQSDDLTMLVIRFNRQNIPSVRMRHLILKNDIHQIPRLADFVTAIATESGLDQATTMSLNLALEEAVSNVILYAYPKGTKGVVEISANMLDDRIDFTVTDEGLPFDPTQASSPDLSLKAEERPIGGLGIYLVRNIMDQVSYTRKDGKNILLMTKNK